MSVLIITAITIIIILGIKAYNEDGLSMVIRKAIVNKIENDCIETKYKRVLKYNKPKYSVGDTCDYINSDGEQVKRKIEDILIEINGDTYKYTYLVGDEDDTYKNN